MVGQVIREVGDSAVDLIYLDGMEDTEHMPNTQSLNDYLVYRANKFCSLRVVLSLHLRRQATSCRTPEPLSSSSS